MTIEHLLMISANYPAPACPTYGTFVDQFARAIARSGIRCTVIQPVAVHRAIHRSGFPYFQQIKASADTKVDVYRPGYLSVSARDGFSRLGVLNPSRFTLNRFISATERVIRSRRLHPDAIYGHFLYLSGAAAVRLGGKLGIPSFPCVGEGELWTVRKFGLAHARTLFRSATGFVANSSDLERLLIRDLNIDESRIGIFPNGTDMTRFKPWNRMDSRDRFGLPKDRFLVCSAGHFLEKKGIVRVGQAIEGLSGVSGVFAGSGPMPPKASNTVLCRRVMHDEMPFLYSACDVFALPTVVEGSCNAIVEAMACGLPIISSSGTFNDDLLDEEMSIRVDPMDVTAIRTAVTSLRDDPERRNRMAAAALERSKRFDVDRRGQNVMEFMNSLKDRINTGV